MIGSRGSRVTSDMNIISVAAINTSPKTSRRKSRSAFTRLIRCASSPFEPPLECPSRDCPSRCEPPRDDAARGVGGVDVVATGTRASDVSTRSGSRGGLGAATVLMQDWPKGRRGRTERAVRMGNAGSAPNRSESGRCGPSPRSPSSIRAACHQKNVAARHHPDHPPPRYHPAGRHHR